MLDTGPLLGLINACDEHHDWVRSQFAVIEPPLLTCEPVLTEACFLAERELGRSDSVLKLLDQGVVRLAFSLDANWMSVSELIRRYSSVPMSLADACLVRMSELVEGCTVLTLDSDFRIYRRNRRKSIPVLMPSQS